tara:strand:- start:150 stop:266 length:117 start_codon:yes stop_codon:yes gene_type:complete
VKGKKEKTSYISPDGQDSNSKQSPTQRIKAKPGLFTRK